MVRGNMDRLYREIDIFNKVLESKRDNFLISDAMDLSAGLDRSIYIPTVLEDSATSIDIAIRYWNRFDDDEKIPVEEREPIKIYIDCIGGSLTDGFSIADSIKLSKTPIYTYVTGVALSGGFNIAISGHKRFCYPHASFLFHEGSIAEFGGDANKFANFAAYYKKQLEQMKELVISSTGITEEKYKEIKNDDFWMTAQEAKALGCVDIILGEDDVK